MSTNSVSRKDFLKCTLVASAGVAGLSLLPSMDGIAQGALPAWPWPYEKLDPEDVRKRGHAAYYEAGCCYGAFKGIIAALRDKVGEPYTLLPYEMMSFGGGGGAGWGTLCGALNGASAAINLVTKGTVPNALINEMYGWYTLTAFPTEVSNNLAEAGQFLVHRYDKSLPQSVCGSPLCHVSVSAWSTAAGMKEASTERRERCARLTGDVAAFAVELLNRQVDGQFQPTFKPPESVATCLGCHGTAMIDNVAGIKMTCNQCHEEDWKHQ